MRVSRSHLRTRPLGTAGVALLAALGCTIADPPTGEGQPPELEPVRPPAGTISVLFVGNSLTYSNDLPGMVERLLAGADLGPVAVTSYSFPNFGLQDHWVNPLTMSAVAGGWDFVILQQGPSATQGRPSLLDYSVRFADEIRDAGGTPGLYMVWPASSRDFDFDGVSDSYATAAELVDGLLFPAGEAWRAAWRKDASLQLYSGDGFHPSVVGSYLAALVIYEQLSGHDLADLPLTTPADLGLFTTDAQTVRLLHDAAAEANDMFARQARGAPSF